MVQKAEDTETGLLLDVILQETRKHRELMKHLSSVFENGTVVGVNDCEKQMGQLFAEALALVHKVRDGILQGMRIEDAAAKLVDFERGVGEEYVAEMHVRARSLVEENQAVRNILENITEDERGHVEILELLTEIASKK